MNIKTMVYQTTNLKNDKIYIGSTIVGLKKTKYFHKSCADRGESRPIYKAIRRYGFYNFIYNTMAEFDSMEDTYKLKRLVL